MRCKCEVTIRTIMMMLYLDPSGPFEQLVSIVINIHQHHRLIDSIGKIQFD